MRGLYLTTSYDSAKDYGPRVYSYRLKNTARILNISDPEVFVDWLFQNGVLSEADRGDASLMESVQGGKLFQYDVSSKTHYENDVTATAKTLGYDIVIVPDSLGNDVHEAYIATGINVLDPVRLYNSHGIAMSWDTLKELELERENCTPQELRALEMQYSLHSDSPVIWVTDDVLVAAKYATTYDWGIQFEAATGQQKHHMASSVDIVEIHGRTNRIIPETHDGDNGFLMVLGHDFTIENHVLSDILPRESFEFVPKNVTIESPSVQKKNYTIERDLF